MARETTVEVDIEVSTKYTEKVKKAEERLKKVNKVASKMNTPKKPLTEMEKYQQSIDRTNKLLQKMEKQQKSISKLTQIETTLKAKIKIVTTDTESENSGSDVKGGAEANGQIQVLQEISNNLLNLQIQMSQMNSFLLMLISTESMLASQKIQLEQMQLQMIQAISIQLLTCQLEISKSNNLLLMLLNVESQFLAQIIQVGQMQMQAMLISVNLMLGLQTTMNNTNNLLMILFSVGNQLLSVMTQIGQMLIQAVQLIVTQILGFQIQLSQINNLLTMLINLELQFFSQIIQVMQVQIQLMINMLNQLLSNGNSDNSGVLNLILNELIKISANTQIQAAEKAAGSCGTAQGAQSTASCTLSVAGEGLGTIVQIMDSLNITHDFLKNFADPKIFEGFKAVVQGVFSLFTANPIIAVIVAVVAVFILLYTKCEGFRNVVNEVLKFILNLFIQNWELIKIVVMTAFQIIQEIIIVAVEIIVAIIQGIVVVFTFIWETICLIVTTAIEMVVGIITAGIEIITFIINGIVAVFTFIWEQIGLIVQGGIDFITGLWDTVTTKVSEVWQGIVGGISGFMENIKSAVGEAVGWVKNKFSEIVNSIPFLDKILGGGVGKKYSGTNFWKGGLTYVGERGRELIQYPTGERFMAESKMLMNLPKGTRIFTNSKTEKMLNKNVPNDKVMTVDENNQLKKLGGFNGLSDYTDFKFGGGINYSNVQTDNITINITNTYGNQSSAQIKDTNNDLVRKINEVLFQKEDRKRRVSIG